MSLKNKLKFLPQNPGVYIFKNTKEEVLYVGKAKSLRTRVRSYFRTKPNLDPSKLKMIKQVADIETITCDTEAEALILEANLIHQHQPPYNIILRDDKFYLFIKITTNEDIPRVFLVRRLKSDGARYFGPYSSAMSVRQTLKLLRRIFPYKGEKENYRDEIFPHPLFTLQDEGYNQNIAGIINFLQGNRQEIIKTLSHGMKKASSAKQYERAGIFRDQLHAIERLEGSQKVYLTRRESFDIVSVARRNRASAANVFSIRRGRLLAKNTFLLKHRMSSGSANILRQFLLQYYRVAQDIPRVIFIPRQLQDQIQIAKQIDGKTPPTFKIPQRGKKRSLLEMGKLNAKQLLNQESDILNDGAAAKKSLIELATVLGIKSPLDRVETYDISNIQGKLATGSMIVFEQGKPNKKQYRKFKIKLTDSPNDYAMLQEVLMRRFANKHKDWHRPDLVLIDGGRGQLNAAKYVLDKQGLDIPIAAVAKREETLFTYANANIKEIKLPYDSPTLFLIQRMRDESHRFTISYHKLLRSKRQQRSLLDEIPSIGPKTKKILLNHFGSLKSIRSANTEELVKVIGKSKATCLRDWL